MTYKEKSTKNYFRYIKAIYFLGNIIGVTPPHNLENHENRKFLTCTFKVWSLFLGILLIIGYAYCMKSLSRTIFNEVRITTTVIHIILVSFMTMFNIVSVIGAGYINSMAWNMMLKSLNEIAKRLQITFRKDRLKGLRIFIVLGHALFIGILGFDCYSGQSSDGFGTYQYYFIMRAQFYFIFVTVILMCFFARSIRDWYLTKAIFEFNVSLSLYFQFLSF